MIRSVETESKLGSLEMNLVLSGAHKIEGPGIESFLWNNLRISSSISLG